MVRAYDLAPVEDADLVVDHAHGHRVAREAAARVVPGTGEVDPAVAVDPADVIVPRVGHDLALLDLLERSGERRGLWAGQAEPLDRRGHPERLVRPQRVVGGDVVIERALHLGDA